MEAFMEWLQGVDYQALFATIIAYLTANLGGFAALIIGLLKQRTKNFNYQQLLDKAKIELSNENNKRIEDLQVMLYDKLNEVQSNIITSNTHSKIIWIYDTSFVVRVINVPFEMLLNS